MPKHEPFVARLGFGTLGSNGVGVESERCICGDYIVSTVTYLFNVIEHCGRFDRDCLGNNILQPSVTRYCFSSKGHSKNSTVCVAGDSPKA
jgi:hypothetical protein